MEKSVKNKKLRKFLILFILALLLINIPLISAYILMIKYGTFNLYPGEKYIVNIPFFGPSKLTTICGKAVQTDGTLLEGVNVTLKYYNNNTEFLKNTTGADGKYCFTILNLTSNKKFDIYVEYDNSTITNASNNYDLNFDDDKVYSKSSDNFAVLSGNITNYDAEIENGRFEINLQYWPENASERFEIFDYQKYFLNIEPNEVYVIPSSGLNVSWGIDSGTLTGRYKFYIKTSFNAREKTKSIYFNVTA
ncbi:hypothetical protein HYW76_00595 [Candidatus Pacearchaeota archaeon]|nr:hypothetical protein [Candidatus Pacearchaeota archaeon]